MKAFDFLSFAKNIYRERPSVHSNRFLLPALYGGESGRRFEALIVLEAPSVKFTEDRWRPCRSAEEAIQCHRGIFLDWATRGKQARLFQALSGDDRASETASALRRQAPFFRKFYITDIWKDAGFGIANKDRSYKEFWLSKLAIELESVPTRRIIFVGNQAALGARYVQSPTPAHYLPFPSQWTTDARFADLVDELVKEIRGPKAK